VAVSPDDVVVSNGCQEALVLCLRAVAEAGDIIVIESPAFFGILQAVESLGLKALEIPSDPKHGISLLPPVQCLQLSHPELVGVEHETYQGGGTLRGDVEPLHIEGEYPELVSVGLVSYWRTGTAESWRAVVGAVLHNALGRKTCCRITRIAG
jgi:hypothetical protein